MIHRLLVNLRPQLNLREKRAARQWRRTHCQPLTPEHLERLRAWAAQQKQKP